MDAAPAAPVLGAVRERRFRAACEEHLEGVEVLRRGATTLLSLSPKDLAKLEINLPSLNEQVRIAALVKDAQIAYRTALEAAEIRRSLARRLIDARLFGDNQNH